MYLLFALALFHIALVQSSPVKTSKRCQEYTIALDVTSENWKYALDPVKNNYEIAAINAQSGRRDSDSVYHLMTPPSGSETATYTISGTLCEPSEGGNGTVLLATHGVGYDRSYWHPTIQPEAYSFVDFAIGKGYSIFYYDRLSVGKSELINGYVPQVANQAPIVKGLVEYIRSGKTQASADSKVVLLGHSFGSVVSSAILHSSPEIADAAILTGVAYYGVDGSEARQTNQLRLAQEADAAEWGHLEGAYTVWVDMFANAELFFKYPYYDAEVLQYAEKTKQPSGILETPSIATTNFSAPAFEGPVLVMSGEYDFVACEGYCPGVIEKGANEIFPASKNVVTYSHPNSGHAINLSLNATGAFEVITTFLEENGF